MLARFAGIVVLDGSGFPAPFAPIEVFARDDVEFARPLTVVDENGLPIPHLASNVFGGLPTFDAPTETGVVVLRSGTMPSQIIMSIDMIVERGAVAARDAAAAAAQSREARLAAEDAAEQARARGVPTGGGVGQVLTRLSDVDGQPAVGWANPVGGGGGGGVAVIVLDDPEAPPPPGTLPPAVLVIPDEPTRPTELQVLTGPGNVTTAVGGGNATPDLAIDVPANTSPGDLLVLIVSSQSGDANVAGWQAPPGWTTAAHSLVAPGNLKPGRHEAVFTRYVTDPADLAAVGASVTVGAGGILATQRRAAILARTIVAHKDGVVGQSDWWTKNQTTTGVTLPAFTSAVVAAARVAFVWLNTSGGASGATVEGWEQIGRAVDQPGGAGTSSSELIAWWQATSGVDHGAVDVAISPPTTGLPVGLQFAIRGA